MDSAAKPANSENMYLEVYSGANLNELPIANFNYEHKIEKSMLFVNPVPQFISFILKDERHEAFAQCDQDLLRAIKNNLGEECWIKSAEVPLYSMQGQEVFKLKFKLIHLVRTQDMDARLFTTEADQSEHKEEDEKHEHPAHDVSQVTVVEGIKIIDRNGEKQIKV